MENKEYYAIQIAMEGSQAQSYGGNKISIDGYGEVKEVRGEDTHWTVSFTTLTLNQAKEIVNVLQKQIEEVERKG